MATCWPCPERWGNTFSMARHIVKLADLENLVGKDLGASDWLTVEQPQVNLFAEATGDHQWIHVDVARATEALGSPIVHGFLTLSLLPVLSAQLLHVPDASRVINYGCDKLRFTGMVPVGSRIRVQQRCLGVEPKSGGKLLRLLSTFEVDGSERPACVAETLSLLFA